MSEIGHETYEEELNECREILQRVQPIGKVKYIGMLGCAEALRELFPEDDAELIDADWLKSIGFEFDECSFDWKMQFGELKLIVFQISSAENDNRHWRASISCKWQWYPVIGIRRQLRSLIGFLQEMS